MAFLPDGLVWDSYIRARGTPFNQVQEPFFKVGYKPWHLSRNSSSTSVFIDLVDSESDNQTLFNATIDVTVSFHVSFNRVHRERSKTDNLKSPFELFFTHCVDFLTACYRFDYWEVSNLAFVILDKCKCFNVSESDFNLNSKSFLTAWQQGNITFTHVKKVWHKTPFLDTIR